MRLHRVLKDEERRLGSDQELLFILVAVLIAERSPRSPKCHVYVRTGVEEYRLRPVRVHDRRPED
jgi:hypothetical protein